MFVGHVQGDQFEDGLDGAGQQTEPEDPSVSLCRGFGGPPGIHQCRAGEL